MKVKAVEITPTMKESPIEEIIKKDAEIKAIPIKLLQEISIKLDRIIELLGNR